MKIPTQKRIGWTLFCLGLGGTLVFLWVIALLWNEPRVVSEITPWFLGAAVVTICAFLFLRRCYRIESLQGKHICQLSFADLIVVSVFTALFMAIGQALLSEDRFLPGVLPMAVLALLGLLAGLILAGRRNLSGWRRYLYGFGFVLVALGALASGAFVFVLISVVCNEGVRNLWAMIRELLGFTVLSGESWLIFVTFRVLIVGLPIGLLLCRLAQRGQKTAVEPQGDEAARNVEDKTQRNENPEEDNLRAARRLFALALITILLSTVGALIVLGAWKRNSTAVVEKYEIPEEMRRMDSADPEADLKYNVQCGDLRFRGYDGFRISVPGIDNRTQDRYGVHVIEGTSDCVRAGEEERLNDRAREYAKTYNRLLLRYFESTKRPGESISDVADRLVQDAIERI